MAWSLFNRDGAGKPDAEGQTVASPGLTDKLKSAGTGLVVNNLPGAGMLYSYDSEGLRLKPVSQAVLAALAAYGLIKLIGGR